MTPLRLGVFIALAGLIGAFTFTRGVSHAVTQLEKEFRYSMFHLLQAIDDQRWCVDESCTNKIQEDVVNKLRAYLGLGARGIVDPGIGTTLHKGWVGPSGDDLVGDVGSVGPRGPIGLTGPRGDPGDPPVPFPPGIPGPRGHPGTKGPELKRVEDIDPGFYINDHPETITVKPSFIKDDIIPSSELRPKGWTPNGWLGWERDHNSKPQNADGGDL